MYLTVKLTVVWFMVVGLKGVNENHENLWTLCRKWTEPLRTIFCIQTIILRYTYTCTTSLFFRKSDLYPFSSESSEWHYLGRYEEEKILRHRELPESLVKIGRGFMFPRRSGRRLECSTHFYVKQSHMYARRCRELNNDQAIIVTAGAFASRTHISMSQHFVDRADARTWFGTGCLTSSLKALWSKQGNTSNIPVCCLMR